MSDVLYGHLVMRGKMNMTYGLVAYVANIPAKSKRKEEISLSLNTYRTRKKRIVVSTSTEKLAIDMNLWT